MYWRLIMDYLALHIFKCAYLAFVHPLWWNVSSYLLPLFSSEPCHWVLKVSSAGYMLSQYFLIVCSFSFHPLNRVLGEQNFKFLYSPTFFLLWIVLLVSGRRILLSLRSWGFSSKRLTVSYLHLIYWINFSVKYEIWGQGLFIYLFWYMNVQLLHLLESKSTIFERLSFLYWISFASITKTTWAAFCRSTSGFSMLFYQTVCLSDNNTQPWLS